MRTYPNLALHLREATAEAHSNAESSTFVKRFMAGKLDRTTYQRYLLALKAIYTALEAGCAKYADHPALQPLQFPELPRMQAIADDLAFFETSADLTAPQAAVDYAAHIESLAEKSPELLVAHSYVRYLGDLSGGQALARAVTKTFDLEPGAGVAFYRFPEIKSLKQFKDGYRAALDGLPLGEADHLAVVEEAKEAFHWNGKVFAEL